MQRIKRKSSFTSSDEKKLKEAILNIKNVIDKNMINLFFTNSNFELPTQQDIGLKYNLSKSGVSIKYSRFLRNLQKK